jgi:hypothetical protein
MKTFRYIVTIAQIFLSLLLMVATSSQKEVVALYFLAFTYLVQKFLEQSEP